MIVEESKVYDITKEDCQSKIDKLGHVCGGCGVKPQPIETVNNSGTPTYWKGCLSCGQFHTDVPLSIRKTALLQYKRGQRSTYSETRKEHLIALSRDAYRVLLDFQKANEIEVLK